MSTQNSNLWAALQSILAELEVEKKAFEALPKKEQACIKTERRQEAWKEFCGCNHGKIDPPNSRPKYGTIAA